MGIIYWKKMGKDKQKLTKTTEKKTAAEFVLRPRPADDPDYNNPNVPQNILVYVPKDQDDDHTQVTLDAIPESIRGDVLDEEEECIKLREKVNFDETAQKIEFERQAQFGVPKFNKKSEKIPELIKCDNKGNAEEDFSLGSDEEMISTNIKSRMAMEKEIKFKPSSKIDEKKKEIDNLNLKDLLKGNKEKLLDIDDKTLDILLSKSKAKFEADFTEYNEYGLKKDTNPELLQYVTKKQFREGTDLFIPAPNYNEIMAQQENRVDIDIDIEKMDDEYRAVFNLLNEAELNENDAQFKNVPLQDNVNAKDINIIETNTEGGLMDDFILMANDGKLPIELISKEVTKGERDEIKFTEEKQAKQTEPSYKHITKEEKEMLDKKFAKTYDQHYKEKDGFEDFPDDDEGKKAPKQKKIEMDSKEFKKAMNQLLPKDKQIEIKKNKNKNDEEESEEEEEFEDYDEEEEFEDFDEELLDDGKMKQIAESDLKYSDHKILVREKDTQNKTSSKRPKTKTEILGKKFKVINKKDLEEEETVEDISNYLYSKDVLDRDVKVIEGMLVREEREEKEDRPTDPDFELNFKVNHLDITSASVSYGNMPKNIAIEGDIKNYERRLRKDEKVRKEKELKEKQKEILKENEKNKKDKFEKMGKKDKKRLNEFIDKDGSSDEEEEFYEAKFEVDKVAEKEENKMRKKLLREEKKDMRIIKKEIKVAFKDEKNKQAKQIASSNKVLRYGVSVKEV